MMNGDIKAVFSIALTLARCKVFLLFLMDYISTTAFAFCKQSNMHKMV